MAKSKKNKKSPVDEMGFGEAVLIDTSKPPPKLFVSNSELVAFGECPLKWHLSNVERLRPDSIDEKNQNRLSRGTAWHILMEMHARGLEAGKSLEEIRERVTRWLKEELSVLWRSVQAEEFDRLLWMYDGYVEVYGSDDRWEMVSHEMTFEYPMPIPGNKELIATGRVDNLRRDRETGLLWVLDYKSKEGKNLENEAIRNEMLLEDQFIWYMGILRKLGYDIHGVIRDVARTDRLKRPMSLAERFTRIETTYQQRTLDHIWDEKREVAMRLNATHQGEIGIYSVPDTMRCSWKCDFYKPHLESRYSGQSVLEVALGYGFHRLADSALPPELAEEAEDLSW